MQMKTQQVKCVSIHNPIQKKLSLSVSGNENCSYIKEHVSQNKTVCSDIWDNQNTWTRMSHNIYTRKVRSISISRREIKAKDMPKNEVSFVLPSHKSHLWF